MSRFRWVPAALFERLGSFGDDEDREDDEDSDYYDFVADKS